MIKVSFRNQGIVLAVFLILILTGAGLIAGLEGIRSFTFYGLLIFSLFPVCVFFITSIKRNTEAGLQLEKKSLENKQLHEYITASWDSNQKIIHEERILAVKFMMVGISHEINTPLGNALTSVSILESLLEKNQIDNKDIKTALDLSQNSIRRTIDLIGKFKEVAQLSLKEEEKSFKLKKLLYRIIEVKKHKWTDIPVDLNINCRDEMTLNSYPLSLSIILGVFLDNAYESLTVSDGSIEISCEMQGKNILISIKDSGSGIKQENIEHIFDPFFTTTRGENHMGLGLSMAHNLIVNLFGGDIKIESHWGTGTTVIITLPEALGKLKVNLKREKYGSE